MSQSKQYVGLDVSLKETSICVINDADKIVWRGKVESTPEGIASAIKQRFALARHIGNFRCKWNRFEPEGAVSRGRDGDASALPGSIGTFAFERTSDR